MADLEFHKSSYSADSQACVEVARTSKSSAVRDTQNRDLDTLSFDSAEWRAFLTAAKRDEL